MSVDEREVSELTLDECWQVLATQHLGRLALSYGDGVEIFPVNYLAHERTIMLASAPGTKLMALSANHAVAFEIDGHEHATLGDPGSFWSVIVHGEAVRLAADSDIVASGVLELPTWAPGEKLNYVQITPRTVTGRSFLPPKKRANRH